MNADPPPKAPPPTVSQQIFRRATDLLAISLVAIVGLTAGREITAWWRAAEQQPMDTGLLDPQIEWSERPVELQFGESSTAIQRVPFHGDRETAVQRMIVMARSMLELDPSDSRSPHTPCADCFGTRRVPTTEPAAAPPSAEEREWLAALEQLEPEESQPERGSIYVVSSLFPSVVATKKTDGGSRIAGWGLATPAGDNAWTLLMFRPAAAASSSASNIPLPPDARMLLGWNDVSGNRVVSFQGAGSIADWMSHFDRQLGARTPQKSLGNSTGQTARWRTPDGQIDVQLSRHGAQITGLLWMTTPPASHNGGNSPIK